MLNKSILFLSSLIFLSYSSFAKDFAKIALSSISVSTPSVSSCDCDSISTALQSDSLDNSQSRVCDYYWYSANSKFVKVFYGSVLVAKVSYPYTIYCANPKSGWSNCFLGIGVSDDKSGKLYEFGSCR